MNEEFATKLAELMRLGFLASRQTERAVFVSYSGHVNMVSFRIHASKNTPSVKLFDEYAILEYAAHREKLDQWLDRLRDLIGGEVPAEANSLAAGEGDVGDLN